MANSGKVFLHAVGGQEKPSEFVEVTGPTFDVAAHASLKKHGCDVAVVVCAATLQLCAMSFYTYYISPIEIGLL